MSDHNGDRWCGGWSVRGLFYRLTLLFPAVRRRNLRPPFQACIAWGWCSLTGPTRLGRPDRHSQLTHPKRECRTILRRKKFERGTRFSKTTAEVDPQVQLGIRSCVYLERTRKTVLLTENHTRHYPTALTTSHQVDLLKNGDRPTTNIVGVQFGCLKLCRVKHVSAIAFEEILGFQISKFRSWDARVVSFQLPNLFEYAPWSPVG